MTVRAEIFEEPAELVEHATQYLAAIIERAAAERGKVAVALAGGNTPRPVYQRLAHPPYRERLPWSVIDFFLGDERLVPPDHPESNYRMIREAFTPVLSLMRLHRVPTERGAEDAASAYEAMIRSYFGIEPGQFPRFDLVLLGLGTDAHIASLFPRTPALRERERIVVANPVPQLRTTRITLTPPVILLARKVLVLVAGRDKAAAVRNALEAPDDVDQVPAHLLRQATGEVTWLLDRAAAAELTAFPRD